MLRTVIAGVGLLVCTQIHAEDLLEVYRLAEQKDPQFKQVQAVHSAILESRPQARAQLLLPSISLGVNAARNFQEITSKAPLRAFGAGEFEFTSRGFILSITQPIYHYDRFVQLTQADQRIKQAETEVNAARQDLSIRVTERYFGVLAALDNLEFARAEKNALGRQLDQAAQRFEVGLIAITDMQEAQAGYDLAVAQEIQAANQLDNAREALREVTGEYPGELAVLKKEIPLTTPDPADIEPWTAKALSQNLRLVAAQYAVEAAREEIKRQYAGHFPTLDLVGSHGFSATGGRFGDVETDATAIGFELNVPIYQGGQVNSRVREAQHRYEEVLAQLEQERRAAQRQTREAYLGIITGISRVNALRQAVVSHETAVKATEVGFEVGTRTAIDVVTAERELSRARRDYAQARYDYILDTLRLKRAVGTLAPEDLAKVNTWLGQ